MEVFSHFRLIALALAYSLAPAAAAQDARINTELTTETPINGVATTPEGRLFLLYARVDGSKGAQVVEWINDTAVPYPNLEWNSYAEGQDPATHLIRTNSMRIGPDGTLWLVDVGSPAFGAPVILPEGPKLVSVNLTTNQVQRVINMGTSVLSASLLDDIRFNPVTNRAYLTDAGVPSLIVLDLADGQARRVLENDLSTGAFTPVSGEGNLLRSSSGEFQYIYADQHEVSPDGKYYYYQPASGGMSRIETACLDAAFSNSSMASVLAQYVEPFALTPSTGGTAIDADGNIYNSDVDRQAIEKISPNGTRSTLVQDERLLWVDAMWIDTLGRLWLPAAQLNRGTPFNSDGTSFIVKPLYVYSIDIGVGPPAIDHA